jgi:hypothetical protein
MLTSGMRSANQAAMRCSCSGFVKACSRQMATAWTPCDSRILEPFEFGGVERLDDVALGVEALVHLESQRARDERLGQDHEQVVDVVAHLACHLEHVLEPGGRDHGRGRALALDQGVGDQGGAVDGVGDVATAAPARSSRACQPSMTALLGF